MIISHQHKFIFLKATKTAGSSIEIALSKYCGPDDIMTPLTPVEDELRESLGYRTAQNCELALSKHKLPHRLMVKAGKTRQLFYNHALAAEIRPYIEPTVWSNYFKFVVARNPWDRVLSQYYFSIRRGKEISLEAFITPKKLKSINKRGWGLYTINNEIVVDRICRYESLENDLEDVRQRLGFAEPLELPRAKGHFRKDKEDHKVLLTEKQKAMIATAFSREISELGYSY